MEKFFHTVGVFFVLFAVSNASFFKSFFEKNRKHDSKRELKFITELEEYPSASHTSSASDFMDDSSTQVQEEAKKPSFLDRLFNKIPNDAEIQKTLKDIEAKQDRRESDASFKEVTSIPYYKLQDNWLLNFSEESFELDEVNFLNDSDNSSNDTVYSFTDISESEPKEIEDNIGPELQLISNADGIYSPTLITKTPEIPTSTSEPNPEESKGYFATMLAIAGVVVGSIIATFSILLSKYRKTIAGSNSTL